MEIILAMILSLAVNEISHLKLVEVCSEIKTKKCLELVESKKLTEYKDEKRHNELVRLEKKYYP